MILLRRSAGRRFLPPLEVSKCQVQILIDSKQFADEDAPKATCDDSRWVQVLNSFGISNENTFRQFGDFTHLVMGGTLTAVATGQRSILARYTAPKPAVGTEAPTGTLCFIPRAAFFSMTARYDLKVRQIAERQSTVRELAQRAQRGRIAVVDQAAWIDACNIPDLGIGDADIRYDTHSYLPAQAWLQELARDNHEVLVEYLNGPWRRFGTECENHTLLLMPLGEWSQLKTVTPA
jgi:hypothetical protein